MPRAVLDVNVLLSALIRPEGPPGRILALLQGERAFDLVLSPPILVEWRRALRYPRIRKHIRVSDQELEAWVQALEYGADVVEGKVVRRVVAADPEDDKYVAAALDGRAEFVVSGDAHLLALREVEGVQIVTPRVFLNALESRREAT